MIVPKAEGGHAFTYARARYEVSACAGIGRRPAWALGVGPRRPGVGPRTPGFGPRRPGFGPQAGLPPAHALGSLRAGAAVRDGGFAGETGTVE